MLVNNKLSRVQDIETISQTCKGLVRLSLQGNIVSNIPNYRAFVISKFPNLRVLDFQKVTQKERDLAVDFFSKPENLEILFERQKQIDINLNQNPITIDSKISNQQRILELSSQIDKATSLEEIARLEKAIVQI